MSTTCNYLQWDDQYRKSPVSSTLGEAKIELINQLRRMRQHVFISKVQQRQVKVLRERFTSEEAVLQEDFSENFNIKFQNEVMSAHWASNGVTLFTAVLNTRESVSSFVVISDDLQHDKAAVACFNRVIMDVANKEGVIKRLHRFSDGAASQFKNRFSLSLLLYPEKEHKDLTQIDWSFFGTSHGKGPIDGVGGTVKRAVWRRILREQVIVGTAEEFTAVASKCCPNITIMYVTSEEVEAVRNELNDLWMLNPPKPIPALRFVTQ